MSYYDLESVYTFLEKKGTVDIVDQVKVTSITKVGFNDMEGIQWQINVKLVTTPKYKNKLLRVLTNSSWTDDYGSDPKEIKYNLEENLNTTLG